MARCVRGETIVITGLRNIGQPMSQSAQAFGMRLIAWSPNVTPEGAASAGAECVSKEALFSTADVVTINMPESERSIGIVGAAELGRMKSTAFLINTSRALLVDQAALLGALREARIEIGRAHV